MLAKTKVAAPPSTMKEFKDTIWKAADKQPAAIKLVMEQMESMAPRYSEERRA